MEPVSVLFAGLDSDVLYEAYEEEIRTKGWWFGDWLGGVKDIEVDHKFSRICLNFTCIIINEEYRSRVYNIKEKWDEHFEQTGVQIPILYIVTDMSNNPTETEQLNTRIKEIKEHFMGYPFVLTIRTENNQTKFYRSLYPYIYGMAQYRIVVSRQINDISELKQQIVVIKKEKENMQDDFEKIRGEWSQKIVEKEYVQDDLEQTRNELEYSGRKLEDCIRKLYYETVNYDKAIKELSMMNAKYEETERELEIVAKKNEELVALLKKNGLWGEYGV